MQSQGTDGAARSGGENPSISIPQYMDHATPLASDFLKEMLSFARALNLSIMLHRKIWGFAFIEHHLMAQRAIRPLSRGLVFGVGTEKLPSLFAARGCEIVATDGPSEVVSPDWAKTNQFSGDREKLFDPAVVDREVFERSVRFEVCDMNAIPSHFRGFDFCWSSSALEHLGDLEAGLRFIENSLRCLKPGGVAVHVLEYNLSSNEETTRAGDTCLYRARDVDDLAGRLLDAGHSFLRLLSSSAQPMPTITYAFHRSRPTASVFI
jgi:SAM-dependent methyltransferase